MKEGLCPIFKLERHPGSKMQVALEWGQAWKQNAVEDTFLWPRREDEGLN